MTNFSRFNRIKQRNREKQLGAHLMKSKPYELHVIQENLSRIERVVAVVLKKTFQARNIENPF